MMLTTPAASQNKAFPLAGSLNRLSLSESHIKHRNSPSLPAHRNLLIKLNCAEMELANSLILSRNAQSVCREIKGEQCSGSAEHYRYSGSSEYKHCLGSVVIQNGCNNENKQVTGKEKGSTENATLWGYGFFHHEENQQAPTLDDGDNQHIRTCEIFVGHRVTVSKPVQPFGSIPRLSSSRRSNLLIQPALLSSPSSFIAAAKRSDRSTSRRSCTTFRSFWFSLVDIDVHPYILRIKVINVHHCIAFSKAKPGSALTLTGPLTTNDSQRIEAAMLNHTPTRFKFLFLAVRRSDLNAKPHRESVTAHSEQDARRSLSGQFVLSFAGRLPEVNHA
ncbi:host cell division inhibitor Icd-like protein [Yersinia enterocolitica]|uniref:host cell division inhibitor Icd-like protein n=1 Tax=Hafnia paralvei TaxID=546367 RepID=UPI002DD44602|nr:host cell division inhibitor Icd-like protein [Hafnia paralvei]